MIGRRAALVLLSLGLAVALSFQGARGLYEPTEGRYAETAREMRETGNYLEPTVGYQPHWTKPPLTYWAIAGGIALAGTNAWGARAYLVLVHPLTALAVATIGATLWNPGAGLLAGLVYVSSPLPVVSASVVTADALLALWETLAVLAYLKARGGGRSKARRWVCLMWLLFGVAFFTKGPPALLPLLAIVVFHRIARVPIRLVEPVGLIAFLGSALWWYVLVTARHPGLLSYFVGKEVVARSVTGEFHRNDHWWAPFVIYLPTLIVGLGAWVFDAATMARRAGLHRPRRVAARLAQRHTPAVLLLLWFAIPLVFFAASRSRLPLYVLPLFAPLALAVGRGVDLAGAHRRALRIALGSAVLLIALKGVVAHRPSPHDAARLYQEAGRSGGPGARLVLFEEPAQYGFQFYADGNVERVSLNGTEAWADHSLRDYLDGMEDGRRSVVVAGKSVAPALRRVLTSSGIVFSQTERLGRELFVVRRAAP